MGRNLLKIMNKIFKNKKINIILITGLVLILLIISFFLIFVPKIHLKGNTNVVINYGERYIEEGYFATFIGIDVSNKILVKNNVDYDKVGEYEINYKINDIAGLFSGNEVRHVEVVDSESPVIELVGDTILLKTGEEYIEPGYSAKDNYDGDITNKVIIENGVDGNKVGEYEIIYKAIDSSLNESVKKRKVIVYEKNAGSIPIFTYHHFMTSDEKSLHTPYDKYTMSIDLFEQQLKYLHDNNYNSITLDDLYLWYTGKKVLSNKDVVITIDDGNISAYKYAIPLLEKYGFKATIFVITGRITNQHQEWDPSTLKFFNEEIVNDINENHKNIYLASHTHYLHSTINGGCAIESKTEDEIYNDVKASKEVINSDYLAYPFGCNTDASKKALEKAGYKMAFTFGDNKRTSKEQDIYALKRLNVNYDVSMQQFINWLEG